SRMGIGRHGSHRRPPSPHKPARLDSGSHGSRRLPLQPYLRAARGYRRPRRSFGGDRRRLVAEPGLAADRVRCPGQAARGQPRSGGIESRRGARRTARPGGMEHTPRRTGCRGRNLLSPARLSRRPHGGAGPPHEVVRTVSRYKDGFVVAPRSRGNWGRLAMSAEKLLRETVKGAAYATAAALLAPVNVLLLLRRLWYAVAAVGVVQLALLGAGIYIMIRAHKKARG